MKAAWEMFYPSEGRLSASICAAAPEPNAKPHSNRSCWIEKRDQTRYSIALIMDARQLHFSRRGFLKATAALGGGLAAGMTVLPAWGLEAGGKGGAGLKDLPEGSAPPPVPLPHFPDRLHAFVWRNWSLVPVCRLARVVGARDSDIVRLGRAMGLGKPPAISRDQQIRSRLTVLRRNWHLLPYEQLLELLGWTPEQLAFALREDDFLYIKLGSLKPRCQPLRYQPPDETARKREAEIAGVLREEFGPELAAPHEPLFSFVARLSSRPPAPALAAPTPANLRFCYSYFALYGDPLLDEETDPYPEGYLERLAQIGVNGVWLQALLHKLAPFPWEPERSAQYQTRLRHLRRLVARARKHGMGVFLYLNEPRAMPLAFFEKRPQLKGVVEAGYGALCTSAPAVQQFLRNSVAGICRAVPDLGGFLTITASENLTNCWSHGGGGHCPRCGTRSAAEVVAEVNGLVERGH